MLTAAALQDSMLGRATQQTSVPPMHDFVLESPQKLAGNLVTAFRFAQELSQSSHACHSCTNCWAVPLPACPLRETSAADPSFEPSCDFAGTRSSSDAAPSFFESAPSSMLWTANCLCSCCHSATMKNAAKMSLATKSVCPNNCSTGDDERGCIDDWTGDKGCTQVSCQVTLKGLHSDLGRSLKFCGCRPCEVQVQVQASLCRCLELPETCRSAGCRSAIHGETTHDVLIQRCPRNNLEVDEFK